LSCDLHVQPGEINGEHWHCTDAIQELFTHYYDINI